MERFVSPDREPAQRASDHPHLKYRELPATPRGEPPRRRSWAGWAARTLVVVWLVASYAGRWWAEADLINLTARYWWPALVLTYLAAMTITWLRWRRARPLDVALGGLIALLGGALAPASDAPVATQSSPEGALRVVSFNINKDNQDAQRVLRFLKRTEADLIVLLEAAGRTELQEALKERYPYVVDCYGRAFVCATVMLSRRRPSAFKRLAHGDAQNRKALSAAQMTFRTRGQDVTVIAAHLARPWPVGRQGQNLKELTGAIRSAERKGPVLVVGDFNLSPWTFSFKAFAREARLKRLAGLGPSWPARLPSLSEVHGPWAALLVPVLSLDQALISNAWAGGWAEMGPSAGSDHRAVISTVKLR